MTSIGEAGANAQHLTEPACALASESWALSVLVLTLLAVMAHTDNTMRRARS